MCRPKDECVDIVGEGLPVGFERDHMADVGAGADFFRAGAAGEPAQGCGRVDDRVAFGGDCENGAGKVVRLVAV